MWPCHVLYLSKLCGPVHTRGLVAIGWRNSRLLSFRFYLLHIIRPTAWIFFRRTGVWFAIQLTFAYVQYSPFCSSPSIVILIALLHTRPSLIRISARFIYVYLSSHRGFRPYVFSSFIMSDHPQVPENSSRPDESARTVSDV